jgi:hypothetical protein
MNRRTYTRARLAFLVLVVAYIVSLAWLKSGAAKGSMLMVLVIGGLLLEALNQRTLDEVELAAERFGMHWGTLVAGSVMFPLLLLPPVQSFVFGAERWMNQPGNAPLPTSVTLVILGMLMMAFGQLVASRLIAAGWKFLKR